MDGIHDLGGMQGFGPVEVEVDEPAFHHEWESRVFGLAPGVSIAAGLLNTPAFRHAIERMEPGHYLTSSYYEHWLTAAATMAVEEGLVTTAELNERAGAFPLSLPVSTDPSSVDPAPMTDARFRPGDTVVVRDLHFNGHTRCPRYVRCRRGLVVRVDEATPVPEVEAHLRERVLEHTYGVRFDARELWGDDAESNTSVTIDLYERYLDHG